MTNLTERTCGNCGNPCKEYKEGYRSNDCVKWKPKTCGNCGNCTPDALLGLYIYCSKLVGLTQVKFDCKDWQPIAVKKSCENCDFMQPNGCSFSLDTGEHCFDKDGWQPRNCDDCKNNGDDGYCETNCFNKNNWQPIAVKESYEELKEKVDKYLKSLSQTEFENLWDKYHLGKQPVSKEGFKEKKADIMTSIMAANTILAQGFKKLEIDALSEGERRGYVKATEDYETKKRESIYKLCQDDCVEPCQHCPKLENLIEQLALSEGMKQGKLEAIEEHLE